MTEQQFWLQTAQLLQHEKHIVLMVVTRSKGSSPGKAGFLMAVGRKMVLGSIGGGTMEYRYIEKARQGLFTSPQLHDVVHELETAQSSGMICSGSQQVAVIPMDATQLSLLQSINAAWQKGTSRSLSISSAGLHLDASCHDAWYCQQIGVPLTLYIIGGGHVSLALAHVMKPLGFRVVVYDNRPSVSTMIENQAADAKQVINYADVAQLVSPGEHSYVAIMTFGHQQDMQVLQALINLPLAYLGMMASKAKRSEVFAALQSQGISQEALAKVHCPIGIPIKSHTPVEIAISIAAEIIAVKNGAEQ
jgi:xanthine dehydrogenase accessory factor